MTSRPWIYFAALTLALSGCCHIFGSDESDAYDDCADKDEGEECSLCDPDDDDCVETMVIKTCNAEGECASGGEPTTHEHH